MADQAINALSTKTAPETSDQLLLVGAGEPQLIDYDKLADAILNKITSKNYALDAGQMTLLAALNKLNSETPRYENANYRGFSDIITALNAEKDSFSTAASYIFTANLAGGAPHLIVFGIDDTGYGAGLYVNYVGKISFFKIEKGSFYNFKM